MTAIPIPWAELAHRVREGSMRALSIRQPYPHHIFHDGKDVENRDWWTSKRGWFLVHAGVSTVEDRDMIREKALPLGGYVGVMLITGCVKAMNSPWFFGKFGLVISAAAPIDFVKGKGQLGFFAPPLEVLAALEASLLKAGEPQ